MPVTPMIRDFLVQLEELLDRTSAPGSIETGWRSRPATRSRSCRLPHIAGADRDVQLQVQDRLVVVSYGGEPLHLRANGVRAPVRGGADSPVASTSRFTGVGSGARPELPRRVAAPVPRHPHASPEPDAPNRTHTRRIRRDLANSRHPPRSEIRGGGAGQRHRIHTELRVIPGTGADRIDADDDPLVEHELDHRLHLLGVRPVVPLPHTDSRPPRSRRDPRRSRPCPRSTPPAACRR